MRHLFTDTTTATLQMVGDSVRGDVTAADADSVRLDSPWNDFFGTDEYVRFRATVAKPMVQPYFYDGKVQYFAKDETELRQAQAQLQDTPWTMGHPEDDRVTEASQIRGFWDNPSYQDGQDAELYIPADDTEAVRFAITNDEVSIGFAGVLDWVEDPDGETPTLTTDSGETVYADAVQREMVYDHVASVEQGRCPPEKGCGLHADEAHGMSDSAEGAGPTRCGLHTDSTDGHGHARPFGDSEHSEMQHGMNDMPSGMSLPTYEEGAVVGHRLFDSFIGTVVHNPDNSDYVMVDPLRQTPSGWETTGQTITVGPADLVPESELDQSVQMADSEHGMSPKFNEGDWLSWEWNGGEAIGRVETVSTSRALSTSGTTRYPSEENEPVYKLQHYDEEDGSFGNMKVAYESNLSSAEQPDSFTDSVRTVRTEESGVVYRHDESYPYDDASHRYESRDAAREAAAEIGCDGVHKHEGPNGTWYMPCASMDTFDRVTDNDYTDACGCPHMTTLADVGQSCSDGPCRCGLHTFGDAEINGETIDLTVPDGAQSAAEAFLQAKDDGLLGDDCGTGAGTTSAEMIAEGEVTADRLVSKIAPYLARADEYVTRDDHPTDWPDEAWQDCGDAQYASWGWTSLREWAFRTADEIKRAMGEQPTYTDADDAVVTGVRPYETWLASDSEIEGVISYNALMGGQLDESEIPNDGYKDHYVFAADTKSDSSYPLVDADGNLRRGNVAAAWEVYGHADDETLLLSVLAQANERFASSDEYTKPIDAESLNMAMSDSRGTTVDDDDPLCVSSKESGDAHHEMNDAHRLTDDSITNPIHKYMTDGDNGGDGGTDPSDPTEFYDGEPTVEQLADDFGTVQMLVDERDDLQNEVETLTDELRERKRGEAEQKAAELTNITEVWGDEDDLLERFEDDDLTLDDLDEKIEAAESIASSETTTPSGSGGSDGGSERQTVADHAREAGERDFDRTSSGRIDLSSH